MKATLVASEKGEISVKTTKLFWVIFVLFGLVSLSSSPLVYASHDTLEIFPLDKYNQSVSAWLNPNDPNYDQPFLSAKIQKTHFNLYLEHYVGSLSPWNREQINKFLKQTTNSIKTVEQSIIDGFDNEGKPAKKIGYGENFRPYNKQWINQLSHNINLNQFDNLDYHDNDRGIAIDNLHARALPTDDVHFYDHKLAGEGYPFDNLQMSALWAGTPVYIVGETRDHAWVYVITPAFLGWVKSQGIARVDQNFITQWTKAAKEKLAAITHTQTSLVDDKGHFLLSAYVGSVYPVNATSKEKWSIMVPVADADHHAFIKTAIVAAEQAAIMPLAATPHHFADIFNTMINRPYGWGSMYFYNDCSAELKSILSTFGIWLPRHSSDQVTVGKMVDKSSAPAEERLSYLMANGKPFLTIIYISGHVFLYIGNYSNPNKESSQMALIYQNVWGLSPADRSRRSVIGQSVLFPLLLEYPEDIELASQAASSKFQVSYLDELINPTMYTNQIDLKKWMSSEPLLN
jgi:cell wall-associated NlpC family hydrolase